MMTVQLHFLFSFSAIFEVFDLHAHTSNTHVCISLVQFHYVLAGGKTEWATDTRNVRVYEEGGSTSELCA
jgi:hypothetical protein